MKIACAVVALIVQTYGFWVAIQGDFPRACFFLITAVIIKSSGNDR